MSGVKLTKDAAARTARAVRAFERDGGDLGGLVHRSGGDDGDPVRLGKTTAAWAKGTLATITLYESGTPPSETTASPAVTLEKCVNKFANVATGKWVILAKAANGSWYLISAEC